MDRQNRNTKKATKALIVVGAILVLALIGAVIYFYTIKDNGEDDDFSEVTCGCYLIDPAVVNDCGDPKRAFMFNLNTVSSDKTCNASCDIDDVADNLLNSTTPKESFKSCTVRSISDTRCENMILKDQDGKIITGRINPTDEINVEATFDKSTYIDYAFKVNTENVVPDKVEGNKISKKLTDFEGVNSVEIIATAKDAQGEQINSIVCRRVVDLQTAIGTTVTGMVALTEKQADGKTKISSITISVGQLNSENVKIRFSFQPTFTTLTASDAITIESAKGTISMSKLDLYDTKNFSTDSFNVLNNHTGELSITAEVFVDDLNIGSATTTVDFEDVGGEDQEPTDPSDDDDEQPIADADKSSFSVSKSVEQSCVERTVGNNLAVYTIVVKNNKSVTDSVTSIKDKLPLGFTYIAESSTVNGSAIADSTMVTVTPVGDSQEIVWQPNAPWQLQANGTLKITFESTATGNSIPGQNLNEVIVTPVQIPLDPESLRTEVAITVAQDCDNITEEEESTPSTGIFDNFVVRIIFGIMILLTGWLIYVRPEGNILSERIVSSKLYEEIQFNSYKVTNPKKYFEEKTLRKKSKAN